MKRALVSFLGLALISAGASAQSGLGNPILAQDTLLRTQAGEKPDEKRLNESLAKIQIPFVANQGQSNPKVAYYASTFAGTVFVTRDGKVVYSLQDKGANSRSLRGERTRRSGWTLVETFVGAKSRPRGGGVTQTRVSSFVGNDPAQWKSEVATYESVALGEIWPGVDVRLRAYGRNMEKLFTVRPGAKPSRIRMRVAGARSLRVDSGGALVASRGLGEVTFTPPLAYQERDGARREIDVAYEVHRSRYGFRLGVYDPMLPVVIDPLLQATYLGGNSDDVAKHLAIHPMSGDVYVAGETTSINFPGTTGGAQPAKGQGTDAFIARLNAALTTLKQATYLGGTDSDSATALAIHPMSGDVYVAGRTNSTDFPGTAGGTQPTYHGSGDAFIARLNADLTTLDQATYLGGAGSEGAFGVALAIHPTSGDVYVTGETTSTDFPGTAGGAQSASGGLGDAFVARLNAALSTLDQATYLGGSSADGAETLAIHPMSGDVYVAGFTTSADFPGTIGGAQSAIGGFGSGDAFVARLNAALTTLDQATYLGGNSDDEATAIAIHPISHDVYVAGNTFSSLDFPGTTGGAQSAFGGGSIDAFVAHLSADLTMLDQATYLGGSSDEGALALAIHPTSHDVYVAGDTFSTDFPRTIGAAQPTNHGSGDAFIARLNAALTTLDKATYLGGSGHEFARALAIHPTSHNVYVAGDTFSTDFPGTTGAAQAASGGVGDAFVARLTADLAKFGVLNVLVSFNPIGSTFATSPPTKACPSGKFSFAARLTNTSNRSLSHLVVRVTTLTNGNLLQNADGGPGGVGALLTIPNTGAYSDGVLAPGEFVDVPFVICLHSSGPFRFFVDVLGDVE